MIDKLPKIKNDSNTYMKERKNTSAVSMSMSASSSAKQLKNLTSIYEDVLPEKNISDSNSAVNPKKEVCCYCFFNNKKPF